MTGKTHRYGGFLCSVIGFALLRENHMLIDGANEGLQWLMMYPFCYWGSVASDLDHNKHAIPMKDEPSKLINKLLHLTAPLQKSLEKSGATKGALYKFAKLFNAKHRSWQTHSDLTFFTLLFILYCVVSGKFAMGAVDSLLLSIILTGVIIGLIAHFVLDMLTTDGVWSILLVVLGKILRKLNPRIKQFPEKLRIVPPVHFFRTGDSWEKFVQKVLRVLNVLAMIYLLWTVFNIGSLIPYEIHFNLGG